MWFKRLVAMFVAISMLMPGVSSAKPGFLETAPYFREQVFSYDARLGVFVNKTDYPDNICRHIYDYSLPAMLKAAHKKNTGCAGAYYVPPAMFLVPQTAYRTTEAKHSSSATMRRASPGKQISNRQLAYIADAAADAMCSPTAFTRLGLSFDACGRPAPVFSSSAVKCDALGWILKKSCDELALNKKNRRVAYKVSEILNKEAIRLTGRSLVALRDEEGRTVVVAVLRTVAKRLRDT